MKNVFKNKVFIGTVCLVLAAVLSFVLLPRLYKDKTATAQILTLSQTVKAGTEITGEMLSTTEVGAFGLPADVATDKAQVIGMVAAETMYSGEYLMKSHLISAADYSETSTEMEDGVVLLTLKLPSSSAGLAGVLRSSSFVDVYTTVENEDYVTSAVKALSGIPVIEVLNAKLESLDDLDKASADGADDTATADYIPVYIVVKADEGQAKTLIALEEDENFHLALTKAGE